MPTLAAIHRYPIKSTAGSSLQRARVEEEGLVGDRRFMVVKPDGTFLTARTHPGLQLVRAQFDGERLTLTHNTLPPVDVARQEFSVQPFDTEVWTDAFAAKTTNDSLDKWFSEAAGEPARLLWLGERSPRYRESLGVRVSFADGYPLLLISEASLEDLNGRNDGTHVMAQFRPNLVAAGTEPYAEDRWKRIRIGEVTFRIDAPCARCAMVTVDPAKGEKRADKEPLKTLAGYRRGDKGKVYFGQNLVAENSGEIGVDDPIEVLEFSSQGEPAMNVIDR
ncbi:MOSC domain-containing protein [Salinicola socius]|uniref:MOSC domain-containing protein n=1 Tax=Salinicola socius TaxID=404433 RepID=A0A1Q8SN33_9GAMM|nr:MOSC N-terminal beta barrel domain-containing protein [Salinicola socius]OLO02835.1 MOSC domain-containing protein [Salinicola socius]